MYAVDVKTMHESPEGIRTVRAYHVSSDTPDALPTTGENVTGLSSTDRFAPFSIMYVIADVENKVYVADETGTFIAQ